MDAKTPQGLISILHEIQDPRIERNKLHSLTDMLVIAICAVICGADSWAQIARFGLCKLKWFRTFLALPNGIPSHDTFGRVFSRLDPDKFEACFVQWAQQLAKASGGHLIAIDGKTIRRSIDKASNKAAIHMVSAWSNDNQLVLGQLACEEKSNEIKAIPKLLDFIDVKGAVVTIDAMGCQTKIAKKIVEQEGEYVLQIKGNQQALHEETSLLFDECLREDCLGIAHTSFTQENKGHGREERRTIWATEEVDWFADRKKWAGMKSLLRVLCERTIDGETSREYHYYISSLPAANPEKLLGYVRGHWGVENSLHWCLDVSFGDDDRRVRKGYGAENFSRLSRFGLNLLKAEKSLKGGIKTKRLTCGWDHDSLLKVLLSVEKKI